MPVDGCPLGGSGDQFLLVDSQVVEISQTFIVPDGAATSVLFQFDIVAPTQRILMQLQDYHFNIAAALEDNNEHDQDVPQDFFVTFERGDGAVIRTTAEIPVAFVPDGRLSLVVRGLGMAELVVQNVVLSPQCD